MVTATKPYLWLGWSWFRVVWCTVPKLRREDEVSSLYKESEPWRTVRRYFRGEMEWSYSPWIWSWGLKIESSAITLSPHPEMKPNSNLKNKTGPSLKMLLIFTQWEKYKSTHKRTHKHLKPACACACQQAAWLFPSAGPITAYYQLLWTVGSEHDCTLN